MVVHKLEPSEDPCGVQASISDAVSKSVSLISPLSFDLYDDIVFFVPYFFMRRMSRYIILAFCSVLAIYFLWKDAIHGRVYSGTSLSPEAPTGTMPEALQAPDVPAKMIVMGKLSSENTDWVAETLPDWNASIYTVDNTSAYLHTAQNKGREANAYLTFIIQNYDRLPNVSVFIHSHREGFPLAWHTDAVHHDIVRALDSLNITHVQNEGYVNLRCNPDPGCIGLTIEPRRHMNDPEPPLDRDAVAELAWLEAWPFLSFTGEGEPPNQIAAACCAQFAVSREQILQRPLDDYRQYHDWLMGTDMEDEISGRIMEYSWHMMFGKEPVHCPDMMECYMYLYPGKNPYGIDANGEAILPPQDPHFGS